MCYRGSGCKSHTQSTAVQRLPLPPTWGPSTPGRPGLALHIHTDQGQMPRPPWAPNSSGACHEGQRRQPLSPAPGGTLRPHSGRGQGELQVALTTERLQEVPVSSGRQVWGPGPQLACSSRPFHVCVFRPLHILFCFFNELTIFQSTFRFTEKKSRRHTVSHILEKF